MDRVGVEHTISSAAVFKGSGRTSHIYDSMGYFFTYPANVVAASLYTYKVLNALVELVEVDEYRFIGPIS